MRLRAPAFLILVLLLNPPARAGIVDPVFPALDAGFALASAVSGDTLFVAGRLPWVGPLTGGGVPLEVADLGIVPGFPRVKGTVRAVVPDGAGGWYLGGQFTHVGGTARANLAHVLADLSLGSWAPVTDGAVVSLVSTPGEVYLGGSFGTVNGIARPRLARVDRATGALASWSPQPNADVNVLASDGTTLYVGGAFTTIALASRNGMAAFDLAGNAVLPWDPGAGSISPPTTIWSLRCANGVVYAGGNFNHISGATRGGAAALDPTSGAARAWDPVVLAGGAGGVLSFLPIGDTVYLGGGFTSVGGTGRSGLAAVDTSAGALLPWDPGVTQEKPPGSPFPGIHAVYALEQVGSDILAGGIFTQVSAAARKNLVRLDAVSGAPLSPSPACPRQVYALAATGARVFVGGAFSGLGSSARSNLAAARLSTGEPLEWVPNANGPSGSSSPFVTAIAMDANTVYAAIGFNDPQCCNRSQVAAFSRTTGAQLWRRDFDLMVNALALSDSRVLAGGSFTFPGTRLAALDAATGATSAWGASATGGEVLALLPTPDGLAVGGTFSSAGGQPRTRLALLDPGTGLATAWDPVADGAVRALASSGSTLYCGGDFLNAGGAPRARVAAIDLTDGLAITWDPGADATVHALATDGVTVFAGGAFQTFGGQPAARIAAASATGGVLSWWPATVDANGPRTLSLTGSRVFAGGLQSGADVEPTVGLTALMHPGSLLGAPGPATPRAGLTIRVEPQPLRSNGRVHYHLPRAAVVEVDLFDLGGRRVARIQPRRSNEAGEHTVAIASRGLAAGLYVLRVGTPEGAARQKVVILP